MEQSWAFVLRSKSGQCCHPFLAHAPILGLHFWLALNAALHCTPTPPPPAVTDRDGCTPLYCAAAWNRIEAVRLLEKLQCPSSLRSLEGRTPVHVAAEQVCGCGGGGVWVGGLWEWEEAVESPRPNLAWAGTAEACICLSLRRKGLRLVCAGTVLERLCCPGTLAGSACVRVAATIALLLLSCMRLHAILFSGLGQHTTWPPDRLRALAALSGLGGAD